MDQSVKELDFILTQLNARQQQNLFNSVQLDMAILQDLVRMAQSYEKGNHYEELSRTFTRFLSMLQ